LLGGSPRGAATDARRLEGQIPALLDASRVQGTRIFFPVGWTVALVVTEDIHDALIAADAMGQMFRDVS
jgi:hypothetical protein